MSIITCATPGCERPKKTREWCHKHYEFLRYKGMLPKRKCKGCGEFLPDVKGTRYYCSEGCIPECKVDGCPERRFANGWCAFHVGRARDTGSPDTPMARMFYSEGQECSFAGCANAARKTGLCSSHYTQKHKGQTLRKLSSKSSGCACAFCGGPSGVRKGYRKTCSAACSRMLIRHGGALPDVFTCIICTDKFPFVVSGQRRKRFNTKMCEGCRRNSQKHGYSARQLAKRDGATCSLCSKPVDMSLKHPDLMRGSVDHIIPTSLGGSNEPENVALAHLHCNIKKNNRVELAA